MDLADPALGDAEDLADLGEGQALVVVERDDGLLAFGQGVDGAGEQPAQFAVLGDLDGVVGAGVLQGVDQAEPVAALAADVQELFEGDDVGERQRAEDAVQFFQADAHLGGDLGLEGVRRSLASRVA